MPYISRRLKSFRKLYDDLPLPARALAVETYKKWTKNPDTLGLHFKPLRGYDDIWSINVGDHYRAVAVRDGNTVVWIWIGTHEAFNNKSF